MTWSFSSGVCSLGTTTSAAVRFCSSVTWRHVCPQLSFSCDGEADSPFLWNEGRGQGSPSCLPCRWLFLPRSPPSWCGSPVWPPPSAQRSSPPLVCRRFGPEPDGGRQTDGGWRSTLCHRRQNTTGCIDINDRCQSALTLNWASGGPVTITILTLESGDSAGAIWKTKGDRRVCQVAGMRCNKLAAVLC